MRSWDWSQIENLMRRKVGKKGTKWQRCWEEEQKLKEIMERRRMEGSSLQLDAMQRVQELVVSERMFTRSKSEKSQREKENTKMVY